MYEEGRLETRTFNNQHSILCSVLTLHDLMKLGSDDHNRVMQDLMKDRFK